MKRFFTLLACFSLSLALLLSGCSSVAILSFKNNFTNGSEPKENYYEKLTYTLEYDAEGKTFNDLKKTSATDSYIKAEGIKYSGTLVTTLEVGSLSNIPKEVNSDILSDANVVKSQIVYIYSTALNLNASYDFLDGNKKTVTDTITSKAYFLPANLSFAPIYTTYTADMNVLSLSSSNPSNLIPVHYDYKTTYNLKNFKIEKSVIENGVAKDLPDVNGNYTFKSVLDNTQLTFALRNFETSEESSTRLNVLAPAYNEAKLLALSQHTLSDALIGFEPYQNSTETLPIKTFSLRVAEQNAMGASQYFNVQTAQSKEGTVAGNALLVQFAQPIFDYGTISCMGAVVFNLVKVEIVNP